MNLALWGKSRLGGAPLYGALFAIAAGLVTAGCCGGGGTSGFDVTVKVADGTLPSDLKLHFASKSQVCDFNAQSFTTGRRAPACGSTIFCILLGVGSSSDAGIGDASGINCQWTVSGDGHFGAAAVGFKTIDSVLSAGEDSSCNDGGGALLFKSFTLVPE